MEVANLPLFLPLTVPAIWMAPENNSSFFGKRGFYPHQGRNMAKVRRAQASPATAVKASDMEGQGKKKP